MLFQYAFNYLVAPFEIAVGNIAASQEVFRPAVAAATLLAFAMTAAVVDTEGIRRFVRMFFKVAADVTDGLLDYTGRAKAGLPAMRVIRRRQETPIRLMSFPFLPALDNWEKVRVRPGVRLWGQ